MWGRRQKCGTFTDENRFGNPASLYFLQSVLADETLKALTEANDCSAFFSNF
jgi:hypothetical protein